MVVRRGWGTGARPPVSTDTQALRVVKDNAGAVPVFVNTGVRAHNAAEQLSIADGAVVGKTAPPGAERLASGV